MRFKCFGGKHWSTCMIDDMLWDNIIFNKKRLFNGDRCVSRKFYPGLSVSITFLRNQLVKIETASVTEECNFFILCVPYICKSGRQPFWDPRF